MSDIGWSGDPPEHPVPPGNPPPLSGYRPPTSPSGSDGLNPPRRKKYDGWTRQPVFFFPVVLRGALLGYLWASVTHNSASFMRKLPLGQPFDPFSDPTLDASDVWHERLKAAYEQGLPAQQAVRSWVGASEDPEAGGIAADAVEQHAETLEALNQWVNPGGPPVPNPLIQDGMYPDGTPVDRSEGWGPLVSGTVARYPTETASAVKFSPVMKDGQVIGFLWASMTGEAAGYLRRTPAGRTSEVAAGLWHLRLSQSYEAGWTSLQALDFCRSQPEDHLSGIIGTDAPIGEFSTLDQLKAYAQQ